jgi:PAS domain S-box-containing protein
MAIHTAASFLLLGCVLLGNAMRRRALKWSLDMLVTMGFVAAVVVMLMAAAVSFKFTTQLSETARWVSHRQEVLKEIGNAAVVMATMESAQRGYVILGNEELVAQMDKSKARVRATLDALRKLTADNPSQQQQLDQLDERIAERLAFTDQTILVRRQQGFAATQQMVATGRGIALTREINRLFGEMQNEEYRLLDQDQERSREASVSTFLLLPVGVFLSLTISSLGLFFLNEGVGAQVRMKEAWRKSEERFHTVIENLAEGLIIAELNGELVRWNPAALELHGFPGDERGSHWLSEVGRLFELSTVDGRIVPMEQWPISRVLRGERLRDLSMRVRRLDMDWERVFSYSGSIVREPDGKELAFLTMFDITERTRAEEALRVSERQLGSFVEQAPVAMAMLDRNMVYLATSLRWQRPGRPDREMPLRYSPRFARSLEGDPSAGARRHSQSMRRGAVGPCGWDQAMAALGGPAVEGQPRGDWRDHAPYGKHHRPEAGGGGSYGKCAAGSREPPFCRGQPAEERIPRKHVA